MMINTGVLGEPYEFLNPELMPPIANRFLARTELDYLNALQENCITANNVFRIKADASHVELFSTLEFFDYFRDAKFIYLRRKSILDQAISLLLAVETGFWHRTSAEEKQPAVEFTDVHLTRLKHWCAHILRYECLMETRLLPRDIKPLRLFYEDVVADSAAAIKDIAKFILGPDAQIEKIISVNYKVAGDANAKLRRQFKKKYPGFLTALNRLRPEF